MADLADSIESMRQLAVVWREMALDRDPDADVRDLPGLAVRWADCRFPFWNCVTLTDVAADAAVVEERLGRAAEIMRAKKWPGFLWIFEGLLEHEARVALDAAAERVGLAYAFPGVGTSTTSSARSPTRQPPPNVSASTASNSTARTAT